MWMQQPQTTMRTPHTSRLSSYSSDASCYPRFSRIAQSVSFGFDGGFAAVAVVVVRISPTNVIDSGDYLDFRALSLPPAIIDHDIIDDLLNTRRYFSLTLLMR